MAFETVTYKVSKDNYRYNEHKSSIGIDIKNHNGQKLPHPLWILAKRVTIRESSTHALITIPKKLLSPKVFSVIGEEVFN